jgi:hypothetical protein
MHMGIGHDEEKWVELYRLPSITFTLHQPQMRPKFRNLQQASENESRKERGTHNADEDEKMFERTSGKNMSSSSTSGSQNSYDMKGGIQESISWDVPWSEVH